jgi:hypothetical protein
MPPDDGGRQTPAVMIARDPAIVHGLGLRLRHWIGMNPKAGHPSEDEI